MGGGGGEPGSKQHSGQTSGVREGINSGEPRDIFLRKNFIYKLKKQLLSRKISERKLKCIFCRRK